MEGQAIGMRTRENNDGPCRTTLISEKEAELYDDVALAAMVGMLGSRDIMDDLENIKQLPGSCYDLAEQMILIRRARIIDLESENLS
jgi:hypothetical protein